MVTISIRDRGAQALLNRMVALGRAPREMLMPAARDVANLLKRHYRENETRPVKHLGAKKHFWLEVGRSVQNPVEANGGRAAAIAISHPAIRQKLFGGTIVAKRARALTIPVSAEAYEAGTVRNFRAFVGPLFGLGRTEDGQSGVLASRNEDGTVSVHWLLRRAVTQAPDPRALPPVAEMARVAVERMRRVLDRIVRAGGSKPS